MSSAYNKYRAQRTTIDGITFHSKKEAEHYLTLLWEEKAGTISDIKLQPRFKLYVGGIHICTYVADFLFKRGKYQVVQDVKGYKTKEYKIKSKLFQALYQEYLFEEI